MALTPQEKAAIKTEAFTYVDGIGASPLRVDELMAVCAVLLALLLEELRRKPNA